MEGKIKVDVFPASTVRSDRLSVKMGGPRFVRADIKFEKLLSRTSTVNS